SRTARRWSSVSSKGRCSLSRVVSSFLSANAIPARARFARWRAGLHELLVEELVEREAPPAGLGVVQVPRPVHGGERWAQLGNPHGRAQPRRMGIADQREQGVQMLVDEPADLAVRQALGRRIYRKDQAAVGPGLP